MKLKQACFSHFLFEREISLRNSSQMKNIVWILCLTCLLADSTINCNAQSIEDLDKKHGFKDFTLGDSFSKWENQLSYHSTLESGEAGYVYTGSCCSFVFDYPLSSIILGFQNSVLTTIFLNTEKFQKEFSTSGKYTIFRTNDFDVLVSSFTVLFGKPSFEGMADNRPLAVWDGKTTTLMLKYEYLGSEEGDLCYIIVSDKTTKENNLKKGF
jgi:hypothetical protein